MNASDNKPKPFFTERLQRLVNPPLPQPDRFDRDGTSIEKQINQGAFFDFAEKQGEPGFIQVQLQAQRAGSADEEIDPDEADTWRGLALQFAEHRMVALGHLSRLLEDPVTQGPVVEEFLAADLAKAEAVLAQRLHQIVTKRLSKVRGSSAVMLARLKSLATAEGLARTQFYVEGIDIITPMMPPSKWKIYDGHDLWAVHDLINYRIAMARAIIVYYDMKEMPVSVPRFPPSDIQDRGEPMFNIYTMKAYGRRLWEAVRDHRLKQTAE